MMKGHDDTIEIDKDQSVDHQNQMKQIMKKHDNARTKTNESVDSERSLLASRDHVFLTWHNLDFVVPKKGGGGNKQEKEQLFDPSDQVARSTIISQFNQRLSITGKGNQGVQRESTMLFSEASTS